MNKYLNKSCVLSLMVLLTSCTSTTNYDYKPFPTYGENVPNTVNGLKKDFFLKTGKSLSFDESYVDGPLSLSTDRRYREFLSQYKSGISEFEFNKKAKEDSIVKEREEKERIQKEDACNADKKCSNNKKIEDNKNRLIDSYQYVLANFPYDAGSADLTVRTICKNATTAQKNGVGREDFLNALRDEPGASPQGRAIAIKIASACWNLSSLGYNWNEALRQP